MENNFVKGVLVGVVMTAIIAGIYVYAKNRNSNTSLVAGQTFRNGQKVEQGTIKERRHKWQENFQKMFENRKNMKSMPHYYQWEDKDNGGTDKESGPCMHPFRGWERMPMRSWGWR